jgi:large subunit ribosomal protein L23
MASHILIRPVVTEKSELTAKKGHYVFVVERKANKIEIARAIEAMFNVSVKAVNTLVVPGKAKSRSTKTGMIRGIKPAYKKAYITVADGESINIYSGAGNEENAAE